MIEFGDILQISLFEVVANELCPMMMGQLTLGMFCIYSRSANAQPGMENLYGCICTQVIHFLQIWNVVQIIYFSIDINHHKKDVLIS